MLPEHHPADPVPSEPVLTVFGQDVEIDEDVLGKEERNRRADAMAEPRDFS